MEKKRRREDCEDVEEVGFGAKNAAGGSFRFMIDRDLRG